MTVVGSIAYLHGIDDELIDAGRNTLTSINGQN